MFLSQYMRRDVFVAIREARDVFVAIRETKYVFVVIREARYVFVAIRKAKRFCCNTWGKTFLSQFMRGDVLRGDSNKIFLAVLAPLGL